jgi:outer membrane protein assembly factor BamB
MSERTSEPATILREYGPFAEVPAVHGVSFDGERVWLASGRELWALDPASGVLVRRLQVACDAGTAFDGTHLYQLAAGRIHTVDPLAGTVLRSIAAPGPGCSGLAWADGSLWVGQYHERTIHRLDPRTGALLQTLRSDRFVTGVTFADGLLWHGTWEGRSDLRALDPATGEVLARLTLPGDVVISGLEAAGADRLYAGGGQSGRVRAIRRPRRR